eukprot:GHRR01024878.1.p1 GENE.GHRR01024878.1~~GHRR01024878.1.p1  ORF type:complete len:572 (+),score=153.32 GHRR01024878.1:161-1876(+)
MLRLARILHCCWTDSDPTIVFASASYNLCCLQSLWAAGAVLDAVESLAPGEQQGVGAWSNAVGRAFLEPYGLNSDSSTFTANGTAGPVHQQLRNLPQGVEVYIYTPVVQVAQNGSSGETRPFPVMLGAILQQNTSLGFFPIEFSPLYIGCPSYFNNTNPPIGGGFVDPYGFNSQPPNPKPTIPAPILQAFAATNTSGFDNGTILTQETAANGTTGGTATSQLNALLPLPVTAQVEYLVPLKVVMGISSSFITNTFKPGGVISRELTGTEVLRYWNEIDFTGAEIPFADGGAADNTAITILLRRRVIKIVACIAASQNITGLDATDWAGYQWDISGLFGAAPPTHPSYKPQGTIVGTPVDLYNRKTQVFPKEGYQQLYEAISNTTAAGGPTYHLATYQVLTNGYQGVFGGWEVDVLWVVNQQQTDWEAALPSDTAQALAQGRTQPNGGLGGILSNITQIFQQVFGEGSTSGLENFPLISTGKADYSPGLVTLLSQMAAWQIAQLQPQIQQLLGANATLQTVTPGNASQDAQAGGSSGIPGSQSSTNSAGNYSNRWPVLLEVACTILTAYFAL